MSVRLMTGCASALMGSASLAATLPEVSLIAIDPSGARQVKISYTLASAPAVVTLDIETNAVANAADGWVSIGGANLQNLSGAVNVRVDTTDPQTITWKASQSWEGHRLPAGTCRAVITAWPLDNTPDYMVVDLAKTSARRVAYYTAPDYLPGGLFGNDAYRTSMIVMKKIIAKNVPWTMGSIGEAGRCTSYASSNPSYAPETFHQVTLTNNYYIGVFEMTQAQVYGLTGSTYSRFSGERWMRPADEVNLTAARGNDTTYEWPKEPSASSIVGIMRTRSGNLVDFEVPSEAQWEFACRAGNGEGKWGDGSSYTNKTVDLGMPGRHVYTGGYLYDGSTYTKPTVYTYTADECGTAVVGSYAPNEFGLYDMHGNVGEWTLDYVSEDPSALNGAVCTNRAAALFAGSYRHVTKGGSWSDAAQFCRSANRESSKPADALIYMYWPATTGFRVVARMGLE